ncbi:MAG: anhydro-N-acetylmuramic acid kinase [Bryobacterales bacterium]|jgi:anhydro-N-acetylmuramic acid kinase|nr:anhydro-N-acetylmuramic acid kinase [Bryobacterales bacterium]
MRVAGVMSGTSLDGIDVAVTDIHGKRVETLAFETVPYPKAVRDAILGVSNTATTTAAIARLGFDLGRRYARAIAGTCRRAKIAEASLELVGCHGQTIYHEGGVATLQVGEAAVIAEELGVPVVSDFRPRDIAAGGQGAPLVPFVDCRLFGNDGAERVALNIGGIANVTATRTGLAFDTGPGNMVIDALAGAATGGRQRFDRDGHLAAQGTVHRGLLDELLADPYYKRKPPKSAGREQYGREFVARLTATGLPVRDLIATATALTAATIAGGVKRFVPRATEVIVSGGGLHNTRLMAQLAAFLDGTRLCPSSDYGIHPDAKEAIAFALLAHETWHRRPASVPAATGARHAVILGKITYP